MLVKKTWRKPSESQSDLVRHKEKQCVVIPCWNTAAMYIYHTVCTYVHTMTLGRRLPLVNMRRRRLLDRRNGIGAVAWLPAWKIQQLLGSYVSEVDNGASAIWCLLLVELAEVSFHCYGPQPDVELRMVPVNKSTRSGSINLVDEDK